MSLDYGIESFKKAISKFVDKQYVTMEYINSSDSKIRASLIAWNKQANRDNQEGIEFSKSSRFFPYPLTRLRACLSNRTSISGASMCEVIHSRITDFTTPLEWAKSKLLDYGVTVEDKEDALEFTVDGTGVVYTGDTTSDQSIEEIVLSLPLIGKEFIITNFLLTTDGDVWQFELMQHLNIFSKKYDIDIIDITDGRECLTGWEYNIFLASYTDLGVDADFINGLREQLISNTDFDWLITYKGTSFEKHGNGFGGLKDLTWKESDTYYTDIIIPTVLDDYNYVESEKVVNGFSRIVKYDGICFGLSKIENVRIMHKNLKGK